MATKAKVARLEHEIEKSRSESNWSKAVDLARQMSTKSQKQGIRFYTLYIADPETSERGGGKKHEI